MSASDSSLRHQCNLQAPCRSAPHDFVDTGRGNRLAGDGGFSPPQRHFLASKRRYRLRGPRTGWPASAPSQAASLRWDTETSAAGAAGCIHSGCKIPSTIWHPGRPCKTSESATLFNVGRCRGYQVNARIRRSRFTSSRRSCGSARRCGITWARSAASISIPQRTRRSGFAFLKCRKRSIAQTHWGFAPSFPSARPKTTHAWKIAGRDSSLEFRSGFFLPWLHQSVVASWQRVPTPSASRHFPYDRLARCSSLDARARVAVAAGTV